MFELSGKEDLPRLAFLSIGVIVKCQGGQSINDSIASYITPVISFNSDNTHDNSRINPKFFFSTLKSFLIFLPKCNTSRGSFVGHKNLTVFMPWFGFFCGATHGFYYTFLVRCTCQPRLNFGLFEIVLIDHRIYKI